MISEKKPCRHKHTNTIQFKIGVGILICQIQSGWHFESFVAFSEYMNFTKIEIQNSNLNMMIDVNCYVLWKEKKKIRSLKCQISF